MNDIEDLEDVLDSLVFEEEPSVLTDECAVDIMITAFHLMDEYISEHPNAISDPDFYETLLEEVKYMFYVQLEDHIWSNDYIEDDVNDIIEVAFDIYTTTFHTERSLQEDAFLSEEESPEPISENTMLENAVIAEKIRLLKELPQPVQRTPEWYKFRWNLITASNAWKAFESQSTMNQLIYEKCQPLKEYGGGGDGDGTEDKPVQMVNTNTTLHWGQKYEPLSVLLYEHLYGSKVEDFGCIQHPVYKFIGASPDGIVTESTTGRYGRMLEIKNIVNREINGIPKKEYWIQMQLQMEVCDLDDCDFLETKFVEYPDYSSYKIDSIQSVDNGSEFNSLTTAKDGSYKGTIMYFHTKDGRPYYVYMPLDLWRPEDIAKWEEDTMHTYEGEYIFIKFIYWKLEKMSCVLVKRNREWFEQNVHKLEKVWKIIEQERVTGYEHRAPVRKQKPKVQPSYGAKDEVCFLKVVKLEST